MKPNPSLANTSREDVGAQPESETRESYAEQVTPKLPKIVRFDDLAPCGDELWIENNGQIYRLRRTRQGKLILTK